MISFTTAELYAWIAAYFYPLARILALLAAAPPFNNAGLPRRIRLFFGIAIALALAPALPPLPAIDPASGRGLLILAEQMLIGFGMGFAMRLVFAAVDMAGNLIGNQMGLGFATSYDPQSASQTPVVSEILGIVALLLFLAMDGHLLVLATLARSFSVLPIGRGLPDPSSWANLANAGVIIFNSGLLLSLPVIVALLITNVALGVLGRVAPQLNLIVIGFPATLILGFAALYVGMSFLAAPLQQMFEHGLQAMLGHYLPPH